MLIDQTLVMLDNEVSDTINTCKLYLRSIETNENYFLKFGTNRIGRSPENDIVISNSAFISTFHAQIDIEGTNDNYLCFISDLKSTNKTKIGPSLDSLFILNPQKNYQIKSNDYIVFGQYKCMLCFQNNSGGDTPKIKENKENQRNEEEIEKNNQEEEEQDENIEDEIDKILGNNKNSGKEMVDINKVVDHILSENESTHLSIEFVDKIKKENVRMKKKNDSEDTILYSGDCNIEEASPSFFDKLKSEEDDHQDSDMDFEEDIEKNDQIDKEMEEVDEIIRRESSSQTALSEEEDFMMKEKIDIQGKQDKNVNKEESKTKKDDSDELEESDEKKDSKSPFTIPISTLNPFNSTPISQKKKNKNNLVDLDDSSNALSLTPIKVNSPQRENRVFIETEMSESATLPLDVPSPSSGSSHKRKIVQDGLDSIPSSSISPKKIKQNNVIEEKKDNEEEEEEEDQDEPTPPYSPLVKFESPKTRNSLSPQKKKVRSQNSSPKLKKENAVNSPKSPRSSEKIEKKDFSYFFPGSNSLEQSTEQDSLVKIGSNSTYYNKSNTSSSTTSVSSKGNSPKNEREKKKERKLIEDSNDLSEMSDNSHEREIFKKKDPKNNKSSPKNNPSITANKQLIDSFNNANSDSPADLSPYQEEYLDQVFDEIDEKEILKKVNSDSKSVKENLQKHKSDPKKEKKTKEKEKEDPKKVNAKEKEENKEKPNKRELSKSPPASPKKTKSSSKKKKDKKGNNSPEHTSFLNFISSRKQNVSSDKVDSSYKIMFTGITDKNREEVVKKLGGQLVSSFEKGCTHLVTNKIRLTNKFLCGISLADHIVDIKWLDECKKSGKFVSEENFELKDEENEKKWKFSLKSSIEKSKKSQKLLSGFKLYATPKLYSDNSFIKEMVVAHGGSFLDSPPKSLDKSVIVLSSKEELESEIFKSLSHINFKIYSLEFFLISVLKQELLFKNYSPLAI